jgi:hypothetical protein
MSAKSDNKPKRQHYLTRGYLKGFSILQEKPGGKKINFLHIYDRDDNVMRLQTVEDTAVIRDYYTVPGKDGSKNYELEVILAELDAKGISAIRKLAAQERIDAEERMDIANFVGLARFRTPDMIESIRGFTDSLLSIQIRATFSDVEAVKDMLRGKPDSPEGEEELTKEAQAMIDLAQAGRFRMSMDHVHVMGTSVVQGLEIAPLLAVRKWSVLHRPKTGTKFVTSDSPVILASRNPPPGVFGGVGFGCIDAVIVFPLNENCALVMHDDDGQEIPVNHVEADSKEIESINLDIIAQCKKFVVGSDGDSLRIQIEKSGIMGTRWKSKIILN